MDDYTKKMQEQYRKDIATGKVPNDLAGLVKRLRDLSGKYNKPFPDDFSDALLAKAAYFEEGPRPVLKLIEKLFDLRQEDFKKQKKS